VKLVGDHVSTLCRVMRYVILLACDMVAGLFLTHVLLHHHHE
jgi:hypothetical protein